MKYVSKGAIKSAARRMGLGFETRKKLAGLSGKMSERQLHRELRKRGLSENLARSMRGKIFDQPQKPKPPGLIDTLIGVKGEKKQTLSSPPKKKGFFSRIFGRNKEEEF